MGILQARKLEWVTMPSSRGSSQPRDQIQVSHIAGRFFISWATNEAQEYWSGEYVKANSEIRNFVYLLSIQYMQTTHFERKFNQNFESCYKKVKVAKCLWDPMDYTVNGILQARILECVAFPFMIKSIN